MNKLPWKWRVEMWCNKLQKDFTFMEWAVIIGLVTWLII